VGSWKKHDSLAFLYHDLLSFPRASLSAVLYKAHDRRMMNVSDLEFGPLIAKSGRVRFVCSLTGTELDSHSQLILWPKKIATPPGRAGRSIVRIMTHGQIVSSAHVFQPED
jgi:hypothetical protein